MARNPSSNRALSAQPKTATSEKPKAVETPKPEKAATNATPSIQAPAVQTSKAPKFVMVGSKLPQNLEIQLCQPKTARVTGQFGSVEETINVKVGEIYLLRGTSYPVNKAPKGFPKRPDMTGDDDDGYAMSKIPAEFMARWMEQNRDTDMVRNRIIIVKADPDSLIDDAKDHADVDSGLGPLNPDGDRRAPKSASQKVDPITPDDRERNAA